MNSFKVHEEVIKNYRNYVKSFQNVHDERIRNYVEEQFDKKRFLKEPLIQFNPAYKKGDRKIVEMEGAHKDLPKVFGDFTLYKHQIEALAFGLNRESFIVSSGTGSGKSLTFLGSIFNYLFNEGFADGKISAILVYPMNALINSQYKEIEKYERNYLLAKAGFSEKQKKPFENKNIEELRTFFKETYSIAFPTYKTYTGQENKKEKEEIRDNSPDIILTNYMMLEYIMTRSQEESIREAMHDSLAFLAFDELHTYRGRQGADAAMLVRRIKSFARGNIACFGTSATMASEGSAEARKRSVADFAEKIFGEKFENRQIIPEYLVPSLISDNYEIDIDDLRKYVLDYKAEKNEQEFRASPLANWIEKHIALEREDDLFVRGEPRTLDQIAEELCKYIGIDSLEDKKIRSFLENAERINESAEKPLLPFKLHQFISQTSTVFSELQNREVRSFELKNGRYLEERSDRAKGDSSKQFVYKYPLLFSRYSGVDFLSVKLDYKLEKVAPRDPDDSGIKISKEEFNRAGKKPESFNDGYIIILGEDENFSDYWSEDDLNELPNSYFSGTKKRKLSDYYQNRIPRPIYLNASGKFSFNRSEDLDIRGIYMSAPLMIDPTAGIIYDFYTNENTKLMRLGNEGRSTATTIISYSVVKALEENSEPVKNRKLLSFTDNRQDASLQSGHFNDFMTLVKFRSAVAAAVKEAGEEGIDEEKLSRSVFKKLELKPEDYCDDNRVDIHLDKAKDAVRDFITLKNIYDLERSWKYSFPDLEQCGLVNINYHGLDDFASNDDNFKGLEYLSNADLKERLDFLTQLLNYFRSNFAIEHKYLTDLKKDKQKKFERYLDVSKIWSPDKDEEIKYPNALTWKSPGKLYGKRSDLRKPYGASIRSKLGKFIKNKIKRETGIEFDQDAYFDFMSKLSGKMTGKFLVNTQFQTSKGTIEGYLLDTESLKWVFGNGYIIPDKIKNLSYKEELKPVPNQFFKALYEKDFSERKTKIVGREHTGQISSDDRKKREEDFREGNLSTLFCSPTMELGIDISELNVVHMRNVPPNPANYAQRSGRAGRSGSAAIVFTYCSAFASHDVNYFENPEMMVKGVVEPPRIDLNSEELIRTHLNAFIMMKLGLEVRDSVSEVLENDGKFLVKERIKIAVDESIKKNKDIWIKEFYKVLTLIENESEKLEFKRRDVLKHIESFPERFDRSFDRWRELYRSAVKMKQEANMKIEDWTIKDKQIKKNAENEFKKAQQKIVLLLNQSSSYFVGASEFYIFRYLAAEGFLPGYNFTRLPVRSFIGFKGDSGEYLSRPGFIGLREFGPFNHIYHNGGIYQIRKMPFPDSELVMHKLKISKSSGHAWLDDNEAANNCPVTGFDLSGNSKYYTNLIELSETEAWPRRRISCAEEERNSEGYDIEQYFNYEGGVESIKKAAFISEGETKVELIYDKATKLIQVNKKWARSKDDEMSFMIHEKTGKWLGFKDLENKETLEAKKNVSIFSTDKGDSLYIDPVDVGEWDAISTAYSLKLGICDVYDAEESEISVWTWDDPNKGILVFEAAEGSLGVLSDILKKGENLKKVVKAALKAIHYDPETGSDTRPELPPAGYENLLSYYNQRYHEVLNRHNAAKNLLELLVFEVEILKKDRNRKEQYEYLLSKYDKNSSTERPFIEYLYENDYELPDDAQVNLDEFYISADFVYEIDKIKSYVFCDGGVHDNPEQIKEDEHKRGLMADKGMDVLVWHYKTPIEDFIKSRTDIFKKIK